MSDYDMSIHTNPDARAWSEFYIKTRDEFEAKNPGVRYDDEVMMFGWFANAMMAMHDHIKGIRFYNGDHIQYEIDQEIKKEI